MQQSRRSTPYPSTWEIPLGAGMAIVLVLVLAAHAARALANLLAGCRLDVHPASGAVHRPARAPGR